MCDIEKVLGERGYREAGGTHLQQISGAPPHIPINHKKVFSIFLSYIYVYIYFFFAGTLMRLHTSVPVGSKGEVLFGEISICGCRPICASSPA